MVGQRFPIARVPTGSEWHEVSTFYVEDEKDRNVPCDCAQMAAEVRWRSLSAVPDVAVHSSRCAHQASLTHCWEADSLRRQPCSRLDVLHGIRRKPEHSALPSRWLCPASRPVGACRSSCSAGAPGPEHARTVCCTSREQPGMYSAGLFEKLHSTKQDPHTGCCKAEPSKHFACRRSCPASGPGPGHAHATSFSETSPSMRCCSTPAQA